MVVRVKLARPSVGGCSGETGESGCRPKVVGGRSGKTGKSECYPEVTDGCPCRIQ